MAQPGEHPKLTHPASEAARIGTCAGWPGGGCLFTLAPFSQATAPVRRHSCGGPKRCQWPSQTPALFRMCQQCDPVPWPARGASAFSPGLWTCPQQRRQNGEHPASSVSTRQRRALPFHFPGAACALCSGAVGGPGRGQDSHDSPA